MFIETLLEDGSRWQFELPAPKSSSHVVFGLGYSWIYRSWDIGCPDGPCSERVSISDQPVVSITILPNKRKKIPASFRFSDQTSTMRISHKHDC
jgi:hypothetical protein